MLYLLITLSLLASLTGGFWMIVRRFAAEEVTFWSILSLVFAAKAVSRIVEYAAPKLELFERLGIMMGVYATVISIGLIATAKVRPIPAVLLSIGFSIAALVVAIMMVSMLPAKTPRTP